MQLRQANGTSFRQFSKLDTSGGTIEAWVQFPQAFANYSHDYAMGVIEKGNYRLRFDYQSGKLVFELDNASATSWSLSYNGIENGIYSLAVYDGKLYAGQGYLAGDGDVLVFDGTSWSVSYNGPQEVIYALGVYNGKLYAGQGSGAGDGDVLVFDGTTWSTSYNGAQEFIGSFAVYNDRLYAGQGSGAGDGDVLVFDGTTWSTSYDGAASFILSLAVYDAKLYAGQGEAAGSGDVLVFNGTTWSTSYDGAANGIYGLAVFRGDLYAGQGYGAGQGDVLRFDGTSWTTAYNGPQEIIYSLAIYNGNLYAGQGLNAGDGDVLVYDGSTWGISSDGAQESARSLAEYDGRLYAGQGYDAAGDGDIFVYGNNIVLQSQNSLWDANRWYHIAGTYDGSYMRLYVDGYENINKPETFTIETGTVPLYVGYDAANGYANMTIDEVALYNRTLSATEIADHCKRGALRLKYQVRSGSTNPPTGSFIGPDGTTGTHYSELSNSTTGLPSLSLTNVSNNRYFRYKAYVETDNASYSPELESVVIAPTHYPGDNPTVRNNGGQSYAALESFVGALGAGNAGSVKYQISNDGTNWYYWNSGNWVGASGYSESNTAAEINANCAEFVSDVGTGTFFFTAFLHSDSAQQQVELDQVDLTYTAIVISVSVEDSSFAFGTMPVDTWLTPEVTVIRNDGTVAEDMAAKISQFTDGSNAWTISSVTNGEDQIRAQWSTTSSSGPWTDIAAYDSNFTIATNVAVNDSLYFWLRVQTPTVTTSFSEHSSTLTVTAAQH